MDAPRSRWIDRAAGYVSPRWQLGRLRSRMALDVIASHYDAAQTSRRTQGWKRPGGGPNSPTGLTYSRLRDSARHLVRNNGHAQAALQVITDDTVGWGINPTVKHDAFRAWAESTDIDADGRCDLAGLEMVVMRTVIEAGECLVRRRWRRLSDGLALPMQLQILEPDFLDHSKHKALENGGTIIHGVEFDALGKRAAYWLHKTHPGSTILTGSLLQKSVRVPASEVAHIYRHERPGQVRGATWFAPVLIRINDFDELADATLMKQKISALLTAFTTDVDGTASPLGTEDPNNEAQDMLEPGWIGNLPAGRDLTVVQPPAVREYADYSKTILREIAVGLGLTYEDLTGDYCVAPETKVLRADLRWVRADELKVGDPIVAFDEERPAGRGQRRKWRKAEVVRAGRRDLPCTRIQTDKATLTVSDQHKFLCVGKQGVRWSSKIGYGHQWVRADELKPGDRIAFLAEPWEEGKSYLHGYLKGIADGEGNASRGGARISIAQLPGPVLDEIGEALSAMGFEARLGPANGKRTTAQWEIYGIAQCLRFLGEVRPTRLLERAENMYDGIATSGGNGKRGQQTHAEVIATESVGEKPVVTLETTTHTLITEGLCSHNTRLPFSAARMSRLRHWARVEGWRWRMLVPQLLNPIWEWGMQGAAVAGLETTASTHWTAPPLPMIEPDKEGTAILRNIRTGITTQPEELRRRGYNVDDFYDEIQADQEDRDRRGIVFDSDVRQMTQAGQRHKDTEGAGDGAAQASLVELMAGAEPFADALDAGSNGASA